MISGQKQSKVVFTYLNCVLDKEYRYFLWLFALLVLGAGVFGLERFVLSQPMNIDLDTAFELALANDKGLKAAESDIAKANEGRRQTHRARSITLKIEHDAARVRNQVNDIDINSFQNIISASYPLYTGGLITGNIAAAQVENSMGISVQFKQ